MNQKIKNPLHVLGEENGMIRQEKVLLLGSENLHGDGVHVRFAVVKGAPVRKADERGMLAGLSEQAHAQRFGDVRFHGERGPHARVVLGMFAAVVRLLDLQMQRAQFINRGVLPFGHVFLAKF